MVFQAAKRIATLNAAHEGLVFGRLDLDDRTQGDGPRYIGRIGLRDENRDSLLVDWRAPAAAVFYQATAADPQGVVRRRVLRCSGATVTAVEDDLLDPDQPDADRLPVVGEGALMAQLSRARDRTMHSIVATIQAEQDQAIRAPSKGVVTDHRRPRHRQDRRRAAPRGVPPLLRPPTLRERRRPRRRAVRASSCATSSGCSRPSGETAVALRSLGEVVDGRPGIRHDAPAVADVKGAARMAELMRRAARQAVPGAPREFRVFYRDDTLVPRRAATWPGSGAQLLSQGKRNRQIPRVAVRPARRDVAPGRAASAAASGARTSSPTPCSATTAFLDFAADWWPALDATDVLGWLRDPELLARVGEGVLSPRRPRTCSATPGGRADPTGPSRTSRCSTSCATCSATRPSAAARTTTRWPIWSTRTCPS